jgi:hypothetical protein
MSQRFFLSAALCLAASGAALGQAARPPGSAAPGPVPIPRATFIANMDSDFAKIDANHDGIITAQEFANYHHRLAILQAQQRNRALFAALDANHDGQLSPAEFAQLVGNVPQPNVAPLFGKLDANHDGKVSLVEYRAATLANFDRLDTDKDGVVTPAEMRAGGIIKK